MRGVQTLPLPPNTCLKLSASCSALSTRPQLPFCGWHHCPPLIILSKTPPSPPPLQLCRDRNYPFVRLDGTTTIKKRNKLVGVELAGLLSWHAVVACARWCASASQSSSKLAGWAPHLLLQGGNSWNPSSCHSWCLQGPTTLLNPPPPWLRPSCPPRVNNFNCPANFLPAVLQGAPLPPWLPLFRSRILMTLPRHSLPSCCPPRRVAAASTSLAATVWCSLVRAWRVRQE